ncbi:hypothetical protein ACRAQ6_14000 [Erythrobacter sp. HA6-11]
MADGNLGADLFGNPITLPKAGRGRPEHVWTLENSNRVLLAFVRGLSHAETAKLIGVDAKTLRKHYSRECALKATARMRMEQRQLERLNAQAEQGNVTAERELSRRIEVLRMRDASEKFGKREAAKPKTEKLGKKEQRKRDALLAGAGDEEWGDLGIAPGTAAH